jgi:hypothetical protein
MARQVVWPPLSPIPCTHRQAIQVLIRLSEAGRPRPRCTSENPAKTPVPRRTETSRRGQAEPST